MPYSLACINKTAFSAVLMLLGAVLHSFFSTLQAGTVSFLLSLIFFVSLSKLSSPTEALKYTRLDCSRQIRLLRPPPCFPSHFIFSFKHYVFLRPTERLLLFLVFGHTSVFCNLLSISVWLSFNSWQMFLFLFARFCPSVLLHLCCIQSSVLCSFLIQPPAFTTRHFLSKNNVWGAAI